MDKHLLGALLYASVPFGIAVYLLLVDSGVLRDKSGHDEFYQLVLEHRWATLAVAIVLMLFAGYEFLRYLDAARTP
jgi:hypothetical protein